MRIVVKDLIPGREYNLQFRSKSADDVSEWSNTYRVLISTETSVPEAPTNVQLESVGDSFRATWNSVTMSTDGSPATDLAGYVVKFRNVDSGQTAQFETTDTNFELTYNLNFAAFTPIAGKIGVQVAARNNMKKLSAWSEEVIAQNPPPAPVKNLVVSSQIDAVSATWDAPDNLEDDFKEYRAYVGTSSDFVPSPSNMFWNGVGTTAVYYISTNVDWYIKVVTVDKFEGMSTEVTGGPVRPRSSVTVDVDAPDTPTNLDGTISGYDLNVTWTAPANPDNDLAGYQIGYRPVGGSGWSYATASHEDTSVTISPITRFVNYEVKIQAHDFSFNYSNWSSTKVVNGEVNVAPAVPTGLQVKGAITTAMVLWDANTEDDLYGYEVQFKAASAPISSDPVYATVSRTMSFSENVSDDTTYYARVRAVDLQGLKSAWSAPASGTIGYVNLDAVEARIDDLQNNVIPGLAPKEDTVTEIVVQYAVNSSETTAPTTGWSTATPTRTPGSFIWYRTVVTYGDGSGSTSNPALLTGNTGSQGIQGQKGADGQSLYTWLKYADTPTTGMSDSPAGKTYMGLAFNKASSTESNNYGDYSWSLIKGEQGVPGQPGADGNPTYTWVKYADNVSGGGMSDSPTGKTYIGLAFNKTTATESTTASDYQWSLIQGPKGDTGSAGATGVSVTSVTPFYRTVTTGSAAPAQPSGTGDPAGWSKTEPSYTDNTELYRTERVSYSNGTAAWTAVSKVASYAGIADVKIIAVTADKRVRKANAAPTVSDGAGAPAGALWYEYGAATAPGTGTVLKQTYEWTGSAWQPRGLDRTFIPQLDIATGTFGTFTGDRLEANSIGANKIKTAEIAADSAFLSNLVVTTGHISDLTFDKIDGGTGIIKNVTVKSTLTLGDASNNGIIQSHGYNANQGVRIDKTGIIVNSGSISASALKLQVGQNIMPVAYADFEFPSSYYSLATIGYVTPSVTDTESKYGHQSLRIVNTSTSATRVRLTNSSELRHNISVQEGETYIMSCWAKGGSVAASAFRFFPEFDAGATPSLPFMTVAANSGWTRYSQTVTIPSGVSAMFLSLYMNTGTAGRDFYVDGVQVESKTGNVETPSTWTPGSSITSIDGAMIRTGEIRSNTNVSVNGTQQPMWSINMDGGMQIGSAVIRGNLTVGATSDGTGSVIQSSNYVPNTSGFVLRGSNGFAEFQNVLINMIGTSSKLIAGVSATGQRTEISNIGLQYFGGDVDFPGAISEFGYDLRIIDVTSAEGESESGGKGSVYGIDNQGELNVNTASISNDPYIAGTAMLGTMTMLPEEVTLDTELGYLDMTPQQGSAGSRTSFPSGYVFTASGEKAVAEVKREQQAGRSVLVAVQVTINVKSVSDLNRFHIAVRKEQLDLPTTATVPKPTTSSSQFGNLIWTPKMYGTMTVFGIAGIYGGTRSEVARWMIGVRNYNASDPNWKVEEAKLIFIDLGPRDDVPLAMESRVTADGSTDTTPEPKKTYTSRWYANSITRRQGSYTTPTGDRTGQALQGWTSGMSGNAYQTVLGFTGGAYYGEKGKSITSALSGGATVKRVRIRVTHASGFKQPARLGIQASQGTQASINQTTSTMTAGQTLTTTMNSTFRTRLKNGDRYITFGPGTNTAGTYAAFHGTSGGNSKRVMLEITYER